MPSPKQPKSSPKPRLEANQKSSPSPENNPAAALFNDPAQNTGPDKKLGALIDKFIDLRKQRMDLEAQTDKLSEQEDAIEDTLCSVMLSKNLKSIKRTNGLMVIAGQKHEFFIKPESKDNFFKALKKGGDGGLITTAVNYQTLQGFMNGLLDKVASGDKTGGKKMESLKRYLDERTSNKITVRGLK